MLLCPVSFFPAGHCRQAFFLAWATVRKTLSRPYLPAEALFPLYHLHHGAVTIQPWHRGHLLDTYREHRLSTLCNFTAAQISTVIKTVPVGHQLAVSEVCLLEMVLLLWKKTILPLEPSLVLQGTFLQMNKKHQLWQLYLST